MNIKNSGCTGNRVATQETAMNRWVAPVKYFAYVVLLLLLVAMVYGATMAVTYWTGINV